MKKRFTCLILLAVTAAVLSGCWSRKEMSELAIVLGAGIDRAPGNQVMLTLQLALPKGFKPGAGAGGEQPATWVVSETGRTVYDAQRKLAARLSRHIYWDHNAILVYGEDAARQGIRRYTNFFSRSTQTRETMWTMVARGKAKDILETVSVLENSSAMAAGCLARAGTGYAVKFINFKIMLATKGSNPVASRVEVVASGVTPAPDKEKPVRTKGVALTGTAVFREDKLAGWLDETETKGMLWLRDELEQDVVVLPSPSGPEKYSSIDIIQSHTKVEPQYDGKSVRFNVKIVTEGALREQQSTENITEPEVWNDLENKLAGAIEHQARLALNKARGEYGVDIFNFGTAFHRKYPREWAELQDRWDEVFTGAQVDFTVEAHLRHSGLVGRRTSLRE